MKRTFLLASLAVLLTSFGCSQRSYESFSGYAQGGTYQVKANLKGVSETHEAIAAAIDSLLECIDFSISELSDGAFDVFSGPLFDIWGFGFTTDSLPSDEAVKAAMADCVSRKTLNFNAIAQGYSCDVIAEYLHSLGVKDMLVDIGEIYCEGFNPSGKGWTIGVDNPVDGNNTPGKDLKGIWHSDGTGCGIVTSGNYRKFYIKDGKKYAHTIDPRTGYPVQHNLLSATVTAPSAAEADALATACMVLGPDDARRLVESLDGVEAYLICSDGTWKSEGFNLE